MDNLKRHHRGLTNPRGTLLAIGVLVLAAAGSGRGETEISGAVAGVWTREGNPYIVVDSTWVPQGESLLLQAGVRVLFGEGQGLHVFGLFRSFGSDNAEDSINIQVAEGVEHWRGIRFYGRNQAEINYTYITCPDFALYFDHNCTFSMNHSAIRADVGAMRGLDFNSIVLVGCDITLSYSYIQNKGESIVTNGGTIIIDHSEVGFDIFNPEVIPGLHGQGTSIYLHRLL
ncbi:MAG: hypothetical protein V2A61_08495 [Calditrichota bacterium]